MQKIFDEIVSLARCPDTDRGPWLEGAEQSVEFLKRNRKGEEIVLYAYGPHFVMNSVLVPRAEADLANHDKFMNKGIPIRNAWRIEESYGGGENHRMYLAPPLSYGEMLVILRNFDGMKNYSEKIEINQKFLHSLDLFYVEERNAYCRLDRRGEVEKVIKIYRQESSDPWQKVHAVTILYYDIAKYMTLSNTSLLSRFDSSRYVSDNFPGWKDVNRKKIQLRDLFYRSGTIPGHGSYANGYIIAHTSMTEDDLIKNCKAEKDPKKRRYASFIIFDHKNGRLLETSCGPGHIVKNFEKNSDLPWEISPAFFRPEVLQKYKLNREKYKIEDRRVICRNAWTLPTYDINEAGQVHTYIKYLADLPYEEQLYWQSFNERPKANISKRAYQTDILGEFPSDDDPLHDTKNMVSSLDSKPPAWWSPRGGEIIEKPLFPATDSPEEWGDEILAFDQMIVEGFRVKGLRPIINDNGGSYDKEWKSLKLLEVALEVLGQEEKQAKETIAPLKELHNLRDPAKGHGDTKGKREAIASARKNHGTLRQHVIDLVTRIRDSMKEIIAILSEK